MRSMVSISAGNSKLGAVPSISLPPGLSCGRPPCLAQCYARRHMTYRCAASWERNWKAWLADPVGYMGAVDAFLTRTKPPWFRWHVAGDIPSPEYLRNMADLARRHTGTRFLAFSKRYAWCAAVVLPDNLTIILSAWPNLPLERGTLAVAWYRTATAPDPRIPDNALPCAGECSRCGMLCWNLPALGRDVVFDHH